MNMIAFHWDWADVFRYLVFGQGLTVFVLSAAIIVRYAMLLTHTTPATARALPIHVFLIALSYNQATVWIMWVIYQYLGKGLTYRTPWAFEIFSLGDFALVFMLSHLVIQLRQIRKLRATIDTLVKQNEDAPNGSSGDKA